MGVLFGLSSFLNWQKIRTKLHFFHWMQMDLIITVKTRIQNNLQHNHFKAGIIKFYTHISHILNIYWKRKNI